MLKFDEGVFTSFLKAELELHWSVKGYLGTVGMDRTKDKEGKQKEIKIIVRIL
jgi:hypothetical protein